MTDTTTPSTVAVATQSAWSSKINWTQAIGIAASVIAVITANKVNVPPEQQVAIVGVIQGIQSVASWIMRTWFTKTVTPASVANAATTTTLAVPVAHIT